MPLLPAKIGHKEREKRAKRSRTSFCGIKSKIKYFHFKKSSPIVLLKRDKLQTP